MIVDDLPGTHVYREKTGHGTYRLVERDGQALATLHGQSLSGIRRIDVGHQTFSFQPPGRRLVEDRTGIVMFEITGSHFNSPAGSVFNIGQPDENLVPGQGTPVIRRYGGPGGNWESGHARSSREAPIPDGGAAGSAPHNPDPVHDRCLLAVGSALLADAVQLIAGADVACFGRGCWQSHGIRGPSQILKIGPC